MTSNMPPVRGAAVRTCAAELGAKAAVCPDTAGPILLLLRDKDANVTMDL